MGGPEKVNILMVDDQPAKLLTYEVMLAELGENLLKADSARQALEILLKDMLPAKVHQLTAPQRMQEGHADHEPVTDRVATVACGVHQLGNLGFRQILALPVIGILGPTTANCRLFRS